jgi:hypothetical protein
MTESRPARPRLIDSGELTIEEQAFLAGYHKADNPPGATSKWAWFIVRNDIMHGMECRKGRPTPTELWATFGTLAIEQWRAAGNKGFHPAMRRYGWPGSPRDPDRYRTTAELRKGPTHV